MLIDLSGPLLYHYFNRLENEDSFKQSANQNKLFKLSWIFNERLAKMLMRNMEKFKMFSLHSMLFHGEYSGGSCTA